MFNHMEKSEPCTVLGGVPTAVAATQPNTPVSKRIKM